jgi:stage II sporulation protein AA (anti-sigma F factor antagonist)
MELTEEAAGEVMVVAVNGRLDAEAARQFGERLAALIHDGRSQLLIEASKLDYIGSLGLRALLVAANLAAEAKGWVALCSLTAPVRRVIELGGFGTIFQPYPSREEALAKLCVPS